MPDDFDKLAVVVDWLDACRERDLEALLECYAANAGLKCGHEAFELHGRAALSAYWEARLAEPAPTAFGLEEIKPVSDEVVLDCLDFRGRPVRVVFAFDDDGKIVRSECAAR